MMNDTGCSLQDSGLPGKCLLDRLDFGIVLLFAPFVTWRLTHKRKFIPQERSRLRNLAIYGALVTLLAYIGTERWIVALCHLAILYLQRLDSTKTLPSAEVQLWWSARCALDVSRTMSYPGIPNSLTTASVLISTVLIYWSCPRHPTDYEDATIWGKMNVSFLQETITAAQDHILITEYFAGKPAELNAQEISDAFFEVLDKTDPNERHPVMWAVLKTYRWNVTFVISIQLARNLFTYCRPSVLALFLQGLADLRDEKVHWSLPVYYAAGLAGLTLTSASLDALYSVNSSIFFYKVKGALQSCVYRKSLILDASARETYDSAKIMNLLNVDTMMIQNAFDNLSTLVSAPVSLILCVLQLYIFMGTSVLASVPVFVLFIPFTSWCSKKMLRRFPESMVAKDKRAKSTMTILRNIKSLKLYAWEEPYEKSVLDDRREELNVQRKFLKVSVLLSTISTQLSNIVATIIFMAYLYLSGEALTPQIVFPALSMLALITDPLFAIPRLVSNFGRAFTAEGRLSEFLRQSQENLQNYSHDSQNSSGDVLLRQAHIQWTSSETSPTAIKKIDLSLTKGDLCCVVGKVGSGKSALCKALCGQLYIESGSVSVNGRISYCSQEPWLQFKSLRENITFGLELDQAYYNLVLDACDLSKDISMFEKGDETEIGEKGISLSGGQRARVSLARAVYARSDIIILDDILSAVDEHVSKKLIATLLAPSGLLSDRTVILATNSAKVLKYSNHLVCLERGEILYNAAPRKDAAPYLTCFNVGSDESVSLLPDASFDRRVLEPEKKVEVPAPHFAEDTFSPDRPDVAEMFPDIPIWKVLKRYFQSTGSFIAIFAISTMIMATLMQNVLTIWLTIWSNKNLVGLSASEKYAVVYLVLTLLSGVTLFLSVYTFQGPLVLRASNTLHAAMLRTVLRLPMVFFDRTPMGSIMNRFTGDISSLDNEFPSIIQGFLRSIFSAVMSIVIAVVGAPLLIFIMVPLMIRYNFYRREYIPASRQLQKLNSASRGPILSHIEESVKGVATLSAFGVRNQFFSVYQQKNEYYMWTAFLRSSLRRWLNYRIQFMTAILILCGSLSLVGLVGYGIGGGSTVGMAGIVLHSIQIAATRVFYLAALWTNLEVSLVSVERVLDYTDKETEAPAIIPETEPPNNWPENGIIEFSNYSTRFRPELPNVLKGISLSIKKKEKIGVVGRTGAGKSSLTMALFRILEASDGSIGIDGIKISDIGLYSLRSRLSIIPQDAQIFKGSLRSNLDPLGLADETQLHQVLDLCRLRPHFKIEDGGLDFVIADGGDNVSRGQGQLICLGRALLKEGTVLVLDEATASVDAETDSLVQATIRTEFKDRTIITIAHRLNTVMDSDRILVLDGGEVAEFGSPHELLQAKGAFYNLVQAHKDSDTID